MLLTTLVSGFGDIECSDRVALSSASAMLGRTFGGVLEGGLVSCCVDQRILNLSRG
jgi:hypothetical protein